MSQQQMLMPINGCCVGALVQVYQTCTEFGYFQSSDAPADMQPFGDLFPVHFSAQQCLDIYGIEPSAVYGFGTPLVITSI